MYRRKAPEATTLHEDLQAPEESLEQKRWSFLRKSTPMGCLVSMVSTGNVQSSNIVWTQQIYACNNDY